MMMPRMMMYHMTVDQVMSQTITFLFLLSYLIIQVHGTLIIYFFCLVFSPLHLLIHSPINKLINNYRYFTIIIIIMTIVLCFIYITKIQSTTS